MTLTVEQEKNLVDWASRLKSWPYAAQIILSKGYGLSDVELSPEMSEAFAWIVFVRPHSAKCLSRSTPRR